MSKAWTKADEHRAWRRVCELAGKARDTVDGFCAVRQIYHDPSDASVRVALGQYLRLDPARVDREIAQIRNPRPKARRAPR